MTDLFEQRAARFSGCGQYRYLLTCRWRDGAPLVWVMLNPSVADAHNDDPTIRRVRGFTAREGYPGFAVVNLWALVATDPKDLHARRGAYEEKNLRTIASITRGRDVVAAWGAGVSRCPCLTRVTMILRDAATVRCLGYTKHGQPRHPLMVRKDARLVGWRQ